MSHITAASAPNSIPAAASFSDKVIREELSRILASAAFASSPKLGSFLQYCVEETLAGHSNNIKAYAIAINAFDRPPSFDPQADPIVRIQAGRMRIALERYYQSDGKTSPLKIEVPRGSYIPVFLHNELFASRATDPSLLAPPRHLDALGPSIGVFLFENISDDKSQDHFATGITRQLIVDLARFRDISVVGPLYPNPLKPAPGRSADIGTESGVRFLLQGAIQRHGDQLRVSVNLTDTSTGESLWGKTYDRDVSVANLFELQDEISRRCASFVAGDIGIVNMALTRESRAKAPEDLSAYEAALLGYHWGTVMSEEAFVRALEALEKSVIESPRYALTKALLADFHCVDHLSNGGLFPDGLERAETLAREALELDRDCQNAHWIRGQVHFYRREFDHCRRELECALELNPNNPHALAACGFYFPMLGEWEQGVALTERAIRLNPHHPSWYHFIPAFYNYRKGDLQHAVWHAQNLDVPGLFWGPLLNTVIYTEADQPEQAKSSLSELIELQPGFECEGRSLMSRYLVTDENVCLFASGLEKAGLSLR